jgi:hypothetical protein
VYFDGLSHAIEFETLLGQNKGDRLLEMRPILGSRQEANGLRMPQASIAVNVEKPILLTDSLPAIVTVSLQFSMISNV